MEESDILIVGSGVFGLSTAVHLVKDNKSSDRPPLKVTLLDPQPYDPPPTKGGASDDINKIVRADYEDAFYMELAYETLDAWSSDPEFVAAEVFHRTGWVVFSAKNPPPATTPAVERAPNRKLGASVVQRIRENLRNGSRPDCTADLSLDDVKRKWGGVLAQVDLDVFEPAYSNPNVGWVDVPRAKRIMVDKALKGGVKYEVEEVVELLHGNDEVNGLRCKSGKVYRAKKVLLATGAWTSRLMAPLEDALALPDEERVESQISTYAVCVAHFRLSLEERGLYGQLPIGIYGDQVDMMPPTKDGILKFNTLRFPNTSITESGRQITAPADEDQSIVPEPIKEKATALIKSVAPTLLRDGRSVDFWRACWDCGTVDRNMVLSRHPNPKLRNLYLAVGGSSHSWKFLPIIGRYVANVINGVGNGEKDPRWAWKYHEAQETAEPVAA